MLEWQGALATATFTASAALAAALAALAVDGDYGLMFALMAVLAASFLQKAAGPPAAAVRTLAGNGRAPVQSERMIASPETNDRSSFSQGMVERLADVSKLSLLKSGIEVEDNTPDSGSDWESALSLSVVSSSASEGQCNSGSEKLSGSEKNSEQSNCPSTEWEFPMHESLRNDILTTHDDFLHPYAFLYSVGTFPPFGVQSYAFDDPIVIVDEEKEKLSVVPPATMATLGQGTLLSVAPHAIGAPVASVAKTSPLALPLGKVSAAVTNVAELGGSIAPAPLAPTSPAPVVVVAGHSPQAALRTAAALGTVVAGGVSRVGRGGFIPHGASQSALADRQLPRRSFFTSERRRHLAPSPQDVPLPQMAEASARSAADSTKLQPPLLVAASVGAKVKAWGSAPRRSFYADARQPPRPHAQQSLATSSSSSCAPSAWAEARQQRRPHPRAFETFSYSAPIGPLPADARQPNPHSFATSSSSSSSCGKSAKAGARQPQWPHPTSSSSSCATTFAVRLSSVLPGTADAASLFRGAADLRQRVQHSRAAAPVENARGEEVAILSFPALHGVEDTQQEQFSNVSGRQKRHENRQRSRRG